MRVVRIVVGVLLLVAALPLLLGGGGLWAMMQHRSPDGSFTAGVERISASGYAVVVPDLDALLRRQLSLVQGGQTTLRITARTDTGPAFLGLAPSANLAHYLNGVPYTQVNEVRLARGALPVQTSPVAGTAKPAAGPSAQDFWRRTGDARTGTLLLSPGDIRGQRLALVMMAPDAAAPLSVEATAAVTPRWLNSSTWGMLVLGTVLLLLGLAALTWPARPREIVYVVDPSQVPDIAARLGAPLSPVPATPTPSMLAPPTLGPPVPAPPTLAPPAPAFPVPVSPAMPLSPVTRMSSLSPLPPPPPVSPLSPQGTSPATPLFSADQPLSTPPGSLSQPLPVATWPVIPARYRGLDEPRPADAPAEATMRLHDRAVPSLAGAVPASATIHGGPSWPATSPPPATPILAWPPVPANRSSTADTCTTTTTPATTPRPPKAQTTTAQAPTAPATTTHTAAASVTAGPGTAGPGTTDQATTAPSALPSAPVPLASKAKDPAAQTPAAVTVTTKDSTPENPDTETPTTG